MTARQQSMPLSVDAPLGHRNSMSLLSVLVNKDAPFADERIHSEAIEDAIEFALGSLDKRESRVVNAYFGIDQEHETMAEIAEDMELKRERVRQIRDRQYASSARHIRTNSSNSENHKNFIKYETVLSIISYSRRLSGCHSDLLHYLLHRSRLW
jgi:RNA polymerase primary sigma factor